MSEDSQQLVDAKAAIEQARWLYEHEKRAEGARARATAVLTLGLAHSWHSPPRRPVRWRNQEGALRFSSWVLLNQKRRSCRSEDTYPSATWPR